MPNLNGPQVPSPTPEQRRIAAGQFDRANQVIATGNFDYGIRLLLSCCKLDPANLIYRTTLRRTEKTKYKNNLRGHWLAWLFNSATKAKLKALLRSREYVKVLEHGEVALARNPWDTGAQTAMAEAADELGLLDLAIWTLEQARQKNARDVPVNRYLARLYEKRGNFTQAIALWDIIRKDAPGDVEAQRKVKDLAANETIVRGHYKQAVDGTASARVADAETQEAPPPPKKDPSDTHEPVRPAAPAPTSRPANRFEAEVERLRGRIEADPTNPNPYLQLATHYRKAGQFDKGREVLQQALAPTGNHFEVSLELTDLEIEPFRRNLAVAEEKLRTNPDEEDVRKIRLRLLKEINTRELDLYRMKSDRYPTEMVHRFELGVRLLRAGNVDEAIKELQAARSDPRHQWRCMLYLGYCFRSKNSWRLAKRNFEEALASMPANEEATRKDVLFQLAQGSAEAGDLAEAIEIAHELANMDFGYRDIGRLMSEWQDKLDGADVSH